MDPVIGDRYRVMQLPVIRDRPQKSWLENPYWFYKMSAALW